MATANNNLSKYDISRIPDGKNTRIALVVSEWNIEITEALFKGAKNTLLDHKHFISSKVRKWSPTIEIYLSEIIW